MIDHTLDFIILSLACFRLTRLIVYDKITRFFRKPFFDEVKEKDENGEVEVYYVPKKYGIKKWIGELLSCYWCTGIWSSIFLVAFSYFYQEWASPVVLVLAVAGVASLIEMVVQQLLYE